MTNSRYGETVGTAWRNASAASCALWPEKNVSALITSPPARRWTKFELVINMKTAKTLGLTFPPSLLAIADEVIE